MPLETRCDPIEKRKIGDILLSLFRFFFAHIENGFAIGSARSVGGIRIVSLTAAAAIVFIDGSHICMGSKTSWEM